MHRRQFLSLLARAVPMAVLAPVGGAVAGSDPLPDWQSPLARDHRLAGAIWDVAGGRALPVEAAVQRLATARFVLLGEKHDNPDHHRIQSWLAARVAASRKPALALEALAADQSSALAAHLAANPRDAAGIGAAVGWTESGWPHWRHYAPIAQAVLDSGGPVLATAPPRQTLRDVAAKGLAALPAARIAGLGLDTDLPPPARAALLRAIDDGHCGQLPRAMTAKMADVQRVKDALMAEALIVGAAQPGRDMTLLVAGNGHVRRDHGVPWHLGRLAADAPVLALGILEVQQGKDRPEVYAESFGVGRLPFDLVWFTPRLDDVDACARHAEQFRRARERRQNSQKTR